MNKIFHALLLFLAVAGLSSCEKEEQDFRVSPKYQIIFDDTIDKITADYPRASGVNLKVSVAGAATAVRVASTYSVIVNGVSTPRRVELGTFPVTNGVATVTIPANSLRQTADGSVLGAGPAVAATATTPAIAASSRDANTYVLVVDAVGADASFERRYFTAVILR